MNRRQPRWSNQYRLTLWLLWGALVLCPPLGIAEDAPPPNPFAGEDAPPPDFLPEEELMEAPDDDLGFERPNGGQAPPPDFQDAPPPPEPPRQAERDPEPPPDIRQPPPAQPRTPPPPAARLGGARPRTSPGNPPPSGTQAAPKLEEYLELESSVKGLQVKNFDLPDKDIRDVVTLISKWTGKNFILDSKVRGKITIIGPSQVTLEEAYHAFLAALTANGLTTVRSGKFIRIIESAEARRSPVELYAGDYTPDTPKFITRIVQLRYISADEVQREFRDLTSRQGKLFAYDPTNSIIITDTGENIVRIEQILRTLDVKGFETSLHVLPIQNTSAKAISEMLEQIYDEEGGGARGGTAAARRRTFRRSSLERTRGGGIISKIIPDEATNSLVVLANSQGFRTLRELVRKLDVKVADTGRIHVYYCEYAKAEDLAATLSALASGGSGARTQGTQRPTRGRRPLPGGAQNVRAGSSAGPISAELEGGVKITSDAATNSLVITANSADYQSLKSVIRKLDIPRLQVFVESAILEVTLDTRRDVNVNVATAANGRAFLGGFITDPAQVLQFVTGTGLPEGATVPIIGGQRVQAEVGGQTVNLRSVMGLVQLLARTSNTNLLSTPQIIALDNEEAEFKVQDEIPVQTSFTATAQGQATLPGAATGTIERLKTGIEIKLTPHVNAASRTVRLAISQKVDSTKANTEVPQALQAVQRATTTRETNTNVVVKDGDFVMLGGLMSDKVDETATKIPLLGDIPILGFLFRGTTKQVVKTNLIILLQPKIIGTSRAAADVIDSKFERRDRFLQDNRGGDDEHERDVGEMRSRVLNQKEQGSNNQPGYRSNSGDETLVDPRMGREGTIGKPRPSEDGGVADDEGAQPSPGGNDALMLPTDEDLESAPPDTSQAPNTPEGAPDFDPNAPLLPEPPGGGDSLIPEDREE